MVVAPCRDCDLYFSCMCAHGDRFGPAHRLWGFDHRCVFCKLDIAVICSSGVIQKIEIKPNKLYFMTEVSFDFVKWSCPSLKYFEWPHPPHILNFVFDFEDKFQFTKLLRDKIALNRNPV